MGRSRSRKRAQPTGATGSGGSNGNGKEDGKRESIGNRSAREAITAEQAPAGASAAAAAAAPSEQWTPWAVDDPAAVLELAVRTTFKSCAAANVQMNEADKHNVKEDDTKWEDGGWEEGEVGWE